MSSEPRSRMLQPEELVDVRSRELNIDLEKEQFEEVNVQLSSSDDEDQKPQDKQLGAKPAVVQRQVKLQTREVPQPAPAQQPTQPVQDSKTSPYVYAAIFGAAVVVGYLIYRKL